MGTDTTFPPFESEVNGKITGFDIDMIEAIAKAEGMTVTIKTMPFNGIIPSLQAGSVDAAVAGITIKTSRMQSVAFTDAHYKSGLSVLVKDDSKIKSFADLKGHVVATKKATSSVDYMTKNGIDSLNDGLAKIKKSGEYKQLFVKYFGGDLSGAVNDAKKPGDVAVKD